MAKKKKRKRRLSAGFLAMAVCCGLLGCLLSLRLGRGREKALETAETILPQSGMATAAPENPGAEPFREEEIIRWAEDAKALRLSELMVKNRTTLRDEDGDFSDWLELENCSDRSLPLEGWRLSDKEDGGAWVFPALMLEPGERLLVFASGKDRSEGTLHTDFSLSPEERLSLRAPNGEEAFSVYIPKLEEDCSLVADETGNYVVSVWPTPGESNDAAGYERWQESQARTSPLLISEAMSSNPFGVQGVGEKLDWVELRNVSDESIELSDYYLSDDRNDYRLWRLPEGALAPGQCFLAACDKEGTTQLPCAPFALDGERETLFLSTATELCDYVSLHDLSYLGSCGRLEGKNGFFYFAKPSPNAPNSNGLRRVALSPSASQGGGLFENTPSLTVSLSAPGAIYYTLDGSTPTADSKAYDGPVEMTETTILRAVCLEEDALPSRVLTESYFLNEGHTMPVASLVADSYGAFRTMYDYMATGSEIPGCLAFYEEGGGFKLGCGITMSGATSLELPKKNVSVHFRGAYGASGLDYDLFGGGVTEFHSLAFRAGQDYYTAVIRNELMQNLALQFSPEHVLTQRSRYCVLYVNGNYYGIYALKEKINRDFCASWADVSKESVTIVRSPVAEYLPFGTDVYRFVTENDMRSEENYALLCERLDVDSLIDWAILEGYCANNDISSGNLKYMQSTEGDGRWRTIFYDLDITLRRDFNLFYNVLGPDESVRSQQVSFLLRRLLNNEQFRARFLERLSAALYGPLSDENVLSEIDRLYAGIENELPRDLARWWREREEFEEGAANLRRLVTGRAQRSYEDICALLDLTEQEKQRWFSRPLD